MGSVVHRLPQVSITGGDLHHTHGERDRRFVLPGDMHEVAAQHPVGVEAQVVVRLTFSGGPWNRSDARGHIKNRDQGRFVSKSITKTLLLSTNAFIAVDVESDDVDPASVQAVKGFAKQGVIDRPAKTLNVAFFNAHQGDWRVSPGW